MADLTTGKIIEIIFENAIDTYEEQDTMLDLVKQKTPNSATMQNAGNVIWQSVEQHRPLQEGWDMAGKKQGIVQELYPSVLGVPLNDVVEQRADDLRDDQFWIDSAKTGALQQTTEMNKRIAEAIAIQGSMFVRADSSTVTSGFDFLSLAQMTQNERQAAKTAGRCFLFNDRDNGFYAKDLAARQTLQGRPDDTWKTGQIGTNIAEYDVFNGSFLPNLVGGADPATTVTGDQSFAPEGGSKDATTHVVTNIDYREAVIAVAASASYNVGDKIQFANTAVPVESIGLADKSETGQPMTFTITGKPTATSIKVFPKPIALDDPGLSVLEAASANINTQILNAATVNRLNLDATNKTNLFWEKNSIEVIGGTIPAQKFSEFGGKKVMSETLKNGLTMYMLYDGDITAMTFEYRIFLWYGITVCNPSNCGVAVTY